MRSIERDRLMLRLAMLAASASLSGCQIDTVPQSMASPKLVLIIGDGMDDQQITIARNYLVGHNGRLTLDDLPVRSAVQVQTVSEDRPSQPVYVADSANSATAIASGVLTSAGRIATTALQDEDATTIMELAHAAGYGTGIVTTASLTDATPASFVAHVRSRFCQGPVNMVARNSSSPAFSSGCSQDLKANGGAGSIAEQIAASTLDIALGGGTRYFEQTAEGEAVKSVLNLAEENGFELIDDAGDLTSLSRGSKVLGLFSAGTMPVKWRGTADAAAEPLERSDGTLQLPDAFTCEANPEFAATPTLTAMARAALDHLDDGRSFVLMIESASIDKQSHLRRPCGQIGELGQLDETVALVLDYARAHPETLVLVTADHGQAAKLIPERSIFAAQNFGSPGHFARLQTPEGSVMGINYATNDSPIQEDHSGVEVPLLASGPGVRDLPAMLRQTDIFGIAAKHLGIGLEPR
jgi:alkaline phosphatase